jgi:hypothetical protein
MCIHTINFRKNCFSLLKYFFICPSTYSSRWRARFFFNNLQPPFSFPSLFLRPSIIIQFFYPYCLQLCYLLLLALLLALLLEFTLLYYFYQLY